MTVLMTSEMPGLTQEGYDRLAARPAAGAPGDRRVHRPRRRPGRRRVPGDRAVGVRGRPRRVVRRPRGPDDAGRRAAAGLTFRPVVHLALR